MKILNEICRQFDSAREMVSNRIERNEDGQVSKGRTSGKLMWSVTVFTLKVLFVLFVFYLFLVMMNFTRALNEVKSAIDRQTELIAQTILMQRFQQKKTNELKSKIDQVDSKTDNSNDKLNLKPLPHGVLDD